LFQTTTRVQSNIEEGDIGLSEFTSWRDYWNFERSMIRERRFIRTPETERFIKAVRATSQSRLVDIEPNSIWWRARLGHEWRKVENDLEIQCAYGREGMKPLAEKTKDGRVNCRGIPCLYLASSEETAIAETRPWVGSYVSTAQFKIRKKLKIVDCSVGHNKLPIFFEEPDPNKITEAVWNMIDRAFAKPVSASDGELEYLPTQALAEVFKAEGYDGIGYKSGCCIEGFNLALFDCNNADLVNCGLVRIETLKLSHSDADQRYFVKDA
jgi:hypothetical protein